MAQMRLSENRRSSFGRQIVAFRQDLANLTRVKLRNRADLASCCKDTSRHNGANVNGQTGLFPKQPRLLVGVRTGIFMAAVYFKLISSALLLFTLVIGAPQLAQAQVTPFMQAVAENASKDRDVAAFYKSIGYKAVWTGKSAKSRQRREALLQSIADASAHGLPKERYDSVALEANLRRVKSGQDLGQLEVDLSRLFLRYARDVQTGLISPKDIDAGMVRKVPYRDRASILQSFVNSSPKAFMKSLPPQSAEYARLMKEKLRLEKLSVRGGWGGKVTAKSVKPGETGQGVVQLRNRLIAMGYLKRTSSSTYDAKMQQAVALFQRDHGLVTDGVAGSGTLSQVNIAAQQRLQQVIVAMERERWLNMPLGKRHVWVNITDFQTRIVDNGKVTFQTRSVVGHRDTDRQTPEFSDVMEHMVINPTWHVPRSIATKEYLPLLQSNPNAVSHLRLLDRNGRQIQRSSVDFAQYDESTFPFIMKQPPSRGNALGLVKFMFPNRYNIYLHDTPQKKLFGREVRAFSHGCVRLNDPFDFAYALLAKQERNPEQFFQQKLATGTETFVNLDEHVPVHLVYRTAFTQAKGRIQFRRDVYGRDAKVWRALERAGVSLSGLRG